MEAETAMGVAYVILPRDTNLETPNVGVKKACWWCYCELPALTRNLKIREIVRVDMEDLGRTSVWRRGEEPIGRDPYRR